MTASEPDTRALVNYVVQTQDKMRTMISMTNISKDGDIQFVAGRLTTQSNRFGDFIVKTATMLKGGSSTSEQAKKFLSLCTTLDHDGLKNLAAQLKQTVEAAKMQVQFCITDLRSIHTEVLAINADIQKLLDSVNAQQRVNAQEQLDIEELRRVSSRNGHQSRANRDNALAGCGITAFIAALFFPPLIPIFCCLWGTAACLEDNESDNHNINTARLQNTQTELVRLHAALNSKLEEATRIKDVLPGMIENFEQVYNFWNALETTLESVEMKGQSKMALKRYIQRWEEIQNQFSEASKQLDAYQSK